MSIPDSGGYKPLRTYLYTYVMGVIGGVFCRHARTSDMQTAISRHASVE